MSVSGAATSTDLCAALDELTDALGELCDAIAAEETAVAANDIDALEKVLARRRDIGLRLAGIGKTEQNARARLSRAAGADEVLGARALAELIADEQLRQRADTAEAAAQTAHGRLLDLRRLVERSTLRVTEMRDFVERMQPELARGQRKRLATSG